MKKMQNTSRDGTKSPAGGLNSKPEPDRNAAHRDEQVLISQCRHGDMAAFGQLVQTYQHRLFNTMLRMSGNEDDALELTQETFVRALQGIKKFRSQSSFYTWLFRIGVNLALSHRQRKTKIRFRSLHQDITTPGHQADGLAALMADDQPTPQMQADIQEQHQRVLGALAQLEPAARAIVILRDIEGHNYEQIAHILEVPMGTVKSRLARARMAVRNLLND